MFKLIFLIQIVDVYIQESASCLCLRRWRASRKRSSKAAEATAALSPSEAPTSGRFREMDGNVEKNRGNVVQM